MIELQEAGTCAWDCCWPEPEPVAEAMAAPTPLAGVVGNGTERDGGSRRFLVLLNHLNRLIRFQSWTPKQKGNGSPYLCVGACIIFPQHSCYSQFRNKYF